MVLKEIKVFLENLDHLVRLLVQMMQINILDHLEKEEKLEGKGNLEILDFLV